MKKVKNDFEKICDELAKENATVKCIRSKIEEYVGNDHDRFIKIKAQANDMGYSEYINLNMSNLAAVISILSFVFGLLNFVTTSFVGVRDIQFYCIIFVVEIILVFLALFLVCFAAKFLWGIKRFDSVRKYGMYIKVILEEMEKEKDDVL